MNRLRLALTAGGLAGLAALAACTGSSGGSSAAGQAGRGLAANGGAGAAVPSPARAAGASAAASATGAPRGDSGLASESGGSASSLGSVLFGGRAVIRTADITVGMRPRAVAQQADQVGLIATRLGGEVDNDDRTAGRDPSATLVVRVPPEKLTAALDEFSRLGHERSRHVSTQDVTARVADVNSRVASAQAAIARLRTLYGRAVKVSDVIAIESQLTERESSLEALQAQQRALAAETAMATVTVELVAVTPPPKPKPKPVKHPENAVLHGLATGWHAFTRAAVGIATAAAAVLPFAVLIAIVALAARWFWTRYRRGHPAPPPAPSA